MTALGTSLHNTRKNLARACFLCTQEGEERQKELLEAQIQRAKAATADEGPAEGTELQRDEDGKPLQIALGGASRAAAKEASAAAFPSAKGFRLDDEVRIAQTSCRRGLETPCKSQWACRWRCTKVVVQSRCQGRHLALAVLAWLSPHLYSLRMSLGAAPSTALYAAMLPRHLFVKAHAESF